MFKKLFGKADDGASDLASKIANLSPMLSMFGIDTKTIIGNMAAEMGQLQADHQTEMIAAISTCKLENGADAFRITFMQLTDGNFKKVAERTFHDVPTLIAEFQTLPQTFKTLLENGNKQHLALGNADGNADASTAEPDASDDGSGRADASATGEHDGE